jgi:cysteinyl-tRNA synthetase
MSLKIYNTLTKTKEEFIPLESGKVKMYVCGPTVYDLVHVGNFRGAIFYNLVRNWLEQLGYQVTYVYNFTDIDDKIIDRAKKEQKSSNEISETFIAEFKKDFARLELGKHDFNPKVTEFIEPIKRMIETLIQNKAAYVAGKDVNYSIKSKADYGKLSHRNPEELKAGVRIELDQKKRDPLDFALWKSSHESEPGWDSDWGRGRPGWHIECSVMAKALLGEQIDIHGGGLDLVFPHHENEMAQSESASGKSYVKYWMHNNMINLSGAKMSKSLGNIIKARAFMDQYNPEILKYVMLSVHYRSVTDFSESALDHSIHGLARIYSALAVAQSMGPLSGEDTEFKKIIEAAKSSIADSLNDDFGTPEAFARLFEVTRTFNSLVKRGVKNAKAISISHQFVGFVKEFGMLFSLFQKPAAEFLMELDDMLLKRKNLNRQTIDQLVRERAAFRAEKNFAKSDELRKALSEMGIAVADTAQGSFWEVAK